MGPLDSRNDRARRALCDIADREGTGVLGNLPRVEAMLADLCPGADGAVHSLLAAGKAGAVRSLENATYEQLPAVVAALAEKLADSYGMTRPVADWAAMTWLIAVRPRAAATMLAAAQAAAGAQDQPAPTGQSSEAAPPAPAPPEREPERPDSAAASPRPPSAAAPWAPKFPKEPAPVSQPPMARSATPQSEYLGRWRLVEGTRSEHRLLMVVPWRSDGLKVSLLAREGDANAAKCLHFLPQTDESGYIEHPPSGAARTPFGFWRFVLRLSTPSRLCLTRDTGATPPFGPFAAEYERA